MSNSPKAYVLVGPTASGKSSVVQRIAERTGAFMVSADSMNIYRGMDIGTAKPAAEEQLRAPVFGMDLADPDKPFSVGDWLKAVQQVFRSQKTDSVPIVSGGTGLYVKCLLQGLDDLPAADETLRARVRHMPLDELQSAACKTDPEAYAVLSDKENPRRLIRLIEHGGQTDRQWGKPLPVITGLQMDRESLHRRIAARVDQMYAGGLLDEARRLTGAGLSSTACHAIGYAEAFAVLRGELTEAQAREKTVIRTRQLAKRQMTWFRHQLRVDWVDAGCGEDPERLASRILAHWQRCGPVRLAGICL